MQCFAGEAGRAALHASGQAWAFPTLQQPSHPVPLPSRYPFWPPPAALFIAPNFCAMCTSAKAEQELGSMVLQMTISGCNRLCV